MNDCLCPFSCTTPELQTIVAAKIEPDPLVDIEDAVTTIADRYAPLQICIQDRQCLLRDSQPVITDTEIDPPPLVLRLL